MTLNWRRLLFGKPFPTHHAQHTRLPNSLALPVFASDALSSVAYATEEILLVLVAAGATLPVLARSGPIAVAIAVLLGVVATSYRQTIAAYPQGGGAYRVSRENLGTVPGLTAAAALLIDYVLTVAVSISAGVAAITSAVPWLHDHAVGLAVVFITLICVANLRGAKESGLLFAVPTYCFLASISVMLLIGLFKLLTGAQMTPPQPPAESWGQLGEQVSLFLLLRAFSSGCTALTGIEAVTDGVPAFRAPESKNAQKVLLILAVILITMFLGITALAIQLHVVPFPAEMHGPDIHRHTVVSQIAYAVFGQSWFYYLVQIATAAILILAANTAFVDFPRLCMFLAQDRFLPRQLANVGDRLVYSNGIIGVAVLSALTVAAFGASTHHLIPLYALGVFLSFTLSQSGMVIRWIRIKGPRWQWQAAVNGFGAISTFVVLIIIGVTKFKAGDPVSLYPLTTPLGMWAFVTFVTFVLLSMYHRWLGKLSLVLFALFFAFLRFGLNVEPLAVVEIRLGAWIVMATIPAIVWMFFQIHAHYQEVSQHLTMSDYCGTMEFRNTVILVVGGIHRGIMPAAKYARSISPDVRAVYVEIDPERTSDVLQRWYRYVPDIPLVVLESPYRSLTEPLVSYLDDVERERDDDVVTVIIPEFVTDKWWTKVLHGQNGLLLKWALLFRPGIVVTNIRYHLGPVSEEVQHHPLASEKARVIADEEPDPSNPDAESNVEATDGRGDLAAEEAEELRGSGR